LERNAGNQRLNTHSARNKKKQKDEQNDFLARLELIWVYAGESNRGVGEELAEKQELPHGALMRMHCARDCGKKRKKPGT